MPIGLLPQIFIFLKSPTLWKYQKLADYPYDDCEDNIEQLIALPDDFMPEMDMYREAFNLGCKLGHPVYDMMYLVLARRHSATLLTIDKKFNGGSKESWRTRVLANDSGASKTTYQALS